MVRPYRKPIVVMSPKSRLRHRLAVSERDALAPGNGFEVVIDDVGVRTRTGSRASSFAPARSGTTSRTSAASADSSTWPWSGSSSSTPAPLLPPPYPREEIQSIVDRYPKARDVIWAQEEPRNQGTWFFMASRRHLAGVIRSKRRLGCAGREYSASPAAGYLSVHLEQQRALVGWALGLAELAALKQRTAWKS